MEETDDTRLNPTGKGIEPATSSLADALQQRTVEEPIEQEVGGTVQPSVTGPDKPGFTLQRLKKFYPTGGGSTLAPGPSQLARMPSLPLRDFSKALQSPPLPPRPQRPKASGLTQVAIAAALYEEAQVRKNPVTPTLSSQPPSRARYKTPSPSNESNMIDSGSEQSSSSSSSGIDRTWSVDPTPWIREKTSDPHQTPPDQVIPDPFRKLSSSRGQVAVSYLPSPTQVPVGKDNKTEDLDPKKRVPARLLPSVFHPEQTSGKYHPVHPYSGSLKVSSESSRGNQGASSPLSQVPRFRQNTTQEVEHARKPEQYPLRPETQLYRELDLYDASPPRHRQGVIPGSHNNSSNLPPQSITAPGALYRSDNSINPPPQESESDTGTRNPGTEERKPLGRPSGEGESPSRRLSISEIQGSENPLIPGPETERSEDTSGSYAQQPLAGTRSSNPDTEISNQATSQKGSATVPNPARRSTQPNQGIRTEVTPDDNTGDNSSESGEDKPKQPSSLPSPARRVLRVTNSFERDKDEEFLPEAGINIQSARHERSSFSTSASEKGFSSSTFPQFPHEEPSRRPVQSRMFVLPVGISNPLINSGYQSQEPPTGTPSALSSTDTRQSQAQSRDPNEPVRIKPLPVTNFYQEPPLPPGQSGLFVPSQGRPAPLLQGDSGNAGGSIFRRDPAPTNVSAFIEEEVAARVALNELEEAEQIAQGGLVEGTRRELALQEMRENLQHRFDKLRPLPASIMEWREWAAGEYKYHPCVGIANAAINDALELGIMQTEEINKTNLECQRLEDENGELRAVIEGKSGSGFLTSHEADMMRLQHLDSLDSLSDERTELQASIDGFISQLIEVNRVNELKDEQLRNAAAALLAEQRRANDAETRADELERQLQNCMQRHDTQVSVKEDQGRELIRTKNELASANKEIEIMQKIHKVNRPDAEESQLREDLARAMREVSTVTASSEILAISINKQSRQLQDFRTKVKQLEEKAQATVNLKETLKKELDSANATLRENQDRFKISTSDQNVKGNMNMLQGTVDGLRRENAELQTENARLRAEAKYSNLPQEIAQLIREKTELKGENATSQVSLRSAFRIVNAKENEVDDLKRELASLRVTVSQQPSSQEPAEFPPNLGELQSTISHLRRERSQLQSQLKKKRESHVDEDAEKDVKVARQIAALEGEVESLRGLLREKTERNGRMERESSEATAQHAKLQRKMANEQEFWRIETQKVGDHLHHVSEKYRDKVRVIKNLRGVINGRLMQSFKLNGGTLFENRFMSEANHVDDLPRRERVWVPPAGGEEEVEDGLSDKVGFPPVYIDVGIARVQVALSNLIKMRALHGMQDGDASDAVAVAKEVIEDAISLNDGASGQQDPTSLARAYFWYGITQYYSDNLEIAHANFEESNAHGHLPAFELNLVEGWLTRSSNRSPERGVTAYGGVRGPTLEEMEKMKTKQRIAERSERREFAAKLKRKDDKAKRKMARAELRKRKAEKKISKIQKKAESVSANIENKPSQSLVQGIGIVERPKQPVETEVEPQKQQLVTTPPRKPKRAKRNEFPPSPPTTSPRESVRLTAYKEALEIADLEKQK